MGWKGSAPQFLLLSFITLVIFSFLRLVTFSIAITKFSVNCNLILKVESQ